jgi:DNA-binding LacI/PurR family transcriptional regulator
MVNRSASLEAGDRVTGPADLVHTAERDAAMRESGDRLHMAVLIVEADYSAEAGCRAARRLLGGTPAPTAIVFDDDVMAVAAEADLVRSGIGVPAEVSLLACDDSALCELAVPPLSVLSIDVHEHGVTLGRAVVDVLSGAPSREYPRAADPHPAPREHGPRTPIVRACTRSSSTPSSP